MQIAIRPLSILTADAYLTGTLADFKKITDDRLASTGWKINEVTAEIDAGWAGILIIQNDDTANAFDFQPNLHGENGEIVSWFHTDYGIESGMRSMNATDAKPEDLPVLFHKWLDSVVPYPETDGIVAALEVEQDRAAWLAQDH